MCRASRFLALAPSALESLGSCAELAELAELKVHLSNSIGDPTILLACARNSRRISLVNSFRSGHFFSLFVSLRPTRTISIPKRYAEDISNITASSSKTILKECICHQLSNATKPGAFDFAVGLVGGRPAPIKARRLILRTTGLSDEDDAISVALESRINSFETCQKGDVVMLRDGNNAFRAGKIAQHLELAGMPMSLLYPWTLVRAIAGTCMSAWTTSDDAEL